MPSYERRSFLGKTALAGAGMLAAAGAKKAVAAVRPRKKRTSPSSLELLHVGFLA